METVTLALVDAAYVPTFPGKLGDVVRATAHQLAQQGEHAPPDVLLYAEKAQAFQCRTCRYAVPQNATHGRCTIMQGTIHLDEGCCCAWDANKAMLHSYREPTEQTE